MSLRVKLLKWLVIPLVAVNLAGAAAVYWLAWIPAQTAFYQSLADAAWALVPHVQESGNSVELQLSQQAEQVQQGVAGMTPEQQEYFNRPMRTWNWDTLSAAAKMQGLPIGSYVGEDGKRKLLGSRVSVAAGRAGGDGEGLGDDARREVLADMRRDVDEMTRLSAELSSLASDQRRTEMPEPTMASFIFFMAWRSGFCRSR